MPALTVRYYAAARVAANTTVERVDAGSVGEALTLLRRRHDERFATVVAGCSLLLDGVRVADPSVALAGDAELDVLPPFAGG